MPRIISGPLVTELSREGDAFRIDYIRRMIDSMVRYIQYLENTLVILQKLNEDQRIELTLDRLNGLSRKIESGHLKYRVTKKRFSLIKHLARNCDRRHSANDILGVINFAGKDVLSRTVSAINTLVKSKLQVPTDLIMGGSSGYAINDQVNINFTE